MPPTRAILTYHSLDASGAVVSLRPEIFRQHIRSLLVQGIAVVSLEDILGPRRSEETQPAVALTFDDGFADFSPQAFPWLLQYAFPATVFLVSGYCGKTNDWPSQPPGLGGRALLGWSEIEELSRQGIEFGAHSVTHPDLTRLPLAAAREEILSSRKQIEDRVGRPVKAFAYPYGAESRPLRELVAEHFNRGCSTRLGYLRPDSPRESLERIDVYYLRNRFWFRRLFGASTTRYLKVRAALRSLRNQTPAHP